ncbi:DUF2946 domain-containing protein [Serratia rubidaea]|uniref:DUF2946 domain-containing protein n=1 Tax=Serratia rubidaea TaxID=61652 RepID=UPI001F2853F0|nr:DUF2946 domain-containing protein [Serratia rubidaea]UJD81112.1 DUF2946 domain-containing protein [Serratia rubidaea]UJD85672.1 DUF2946 domain-containing protein [Serratia rubidaea]
MKLSTHSIRTLAWLGLFAMLMVFAGPLISAQLAKKPQHNSMMGMNMPMGEHMMMMHHQADDAPAARHHAAGMMDEDSGDFCGYCSLFHHSPPLQITLPPFLHAPLSAGTISAVIIPAPVIRRLFQPYQTRAPPKNINANNIKSTFIL